MAVLADFNPWLWPHLYPANDLTVDAVLDIASFATWRAAFEPIYQLKVNSVQIGAPTTPVSGAPFAKTGYTLTEISLPFPSGPTIGSLLAVPTVIDPTKKLIIALHGHEVPERGVTPWSMFTPGYWPEKMVQAGHIVWTPSHLWYTQLANFVAQGHAHHLVWTRMLDRIMTAVLPLVPAHTGVSACGLSSGGLGASFLMAYRPDIATGVFAGSFIGLSYLRENYRIQGQPNQYDVPQFFDYAPIYSLIAPKSVQWQMGRQDTFFPKTTQVAGSGAFPGLPRPVSVQDFMGEYLLLERIWGNLSGVSDLHLHSGAHVMDTLEALSFITGH